MSTVQKTLIDAIRRIAKSDPEISSFLTTLRGRGALAAIQTSDSAYTSNDCCSSDENKERAAQPDPEGADISGDAPPDLSGGTPEGWTDCETGQGVQFTPAGFAQAETCKECEPDDTWEQGYFWYSQSYPSVAGATYRQIGGAVLSNIDSTQNNKPTIRNHVSSLVGFNVIDIGTTALVYDATYEFYDQYTGTWRDSSTNNGASFLRRSVCGASTADYCQLTEAPETCGDNWTPDSTTNYTLVNGCITGSSCDPDATDQAKQCNEQIIICDENGNERIIQSIGNGQFIMYDESGTHKGGRYNAATGERLEVLDPGSNGGYGSIE